MYVGEAFEGYLYGMTITSVKSSNSKIVKAAKTDRTYAYAFTAKKAGSATVTVKYKSGSSKGTYKLKVTVKKLDFTIKAQNLDNGYVLFKVKNNTAQTFDKVTFSYTLKDSEGDTVAASSTYASYVLTKNTAYETVYVGSNNDIDCSTAKFKVTEVSRDPNYTYKNTTAKQVYVTKKNEEASGTTGFNLKLTTKNKLNKIVKGVNYIIIYDENNKIIGVEENSLYLSEKETKTSTSIYVSTYSHPTYDHYEIVTKAYSMTKNS
jgi:hypothetical protein